MNQPDGINKTFEINPSTNLYPGMGVDISGYPKGTYMIPHPGLRGISPMELNAVSFTTPSDYSAFPAANQFNCGPPLQTPNPSMYSPAITGMLPPPPPALQSDQISTIHSLSSSSTFRTTTTTSGSTPPRSTSSVRGSRRRKKKQAPSPIFAQLPFRPALILIIPLTICFILVGMTMIIIATLPNAPSVGIPVLAVGAILLCIGAAGLAIATTDACRSSMKFRKEALNRSFSSWRSTSGSTVSRRSSFSMGSVTSAGNLVPQHMSNERATSTGRALREKLRFLFAEPKVPKRRRESSNGGKEESSKRRQLWRARGGRGTSASSSSASEEQTRNTTPRTSNRRSRSVDRSGETGNRTEMANDSSSIRSVPLSIDASFYRSNVYSHYQPLGLMATKEQKTLRSERRAKENSEAKREVTSDQRATPAVNVEVNSPLPITTTIDEKSIETTF